MPFFDNPLEEFLDFLTRFGLEYYRRYYGPYRAKVINNKDPEGLGRIIVEVPRARVPKENGEWVLPMMAGAGKQYGMFWPPEENDYVFVFFDNGDPRKPLGYMGGWYAGGEVPTAMKPEDDGTPEKRGFQTPSGHQVVFTDSDGKEKVFIRHKDGTIVEWTADKKVKIGKENGSYEPMFKASTVKQWLTSHTHPHSWGPTGAPIQPFPANGLSDDVENS
jgi:uncharacterized protein involved in type VI secretion and phage assembly